MREKVYGLASSVDLLSDKEKVCYNNNTPPPYTCTEPDWGQRGEDLVSMAMTFMDYTFKSPWRQEITTAKIQITDQAYKWQWRLLPCINAFQTTSDLQQIQQAKPPQQL